MSSRLVVLSLSSLSLLGLVACSDPGTGSDGPADAEFEPLCGQDGAVELVALAADEDVLTLDRIGDGEIHLRVKVDEELGLYDPPQVRRSVVIDECGEELAEVASPAYFLQWWGDALIGCLDRDLVWLTGYDDPSPSVLAREGCDARQVGERWVTFDLEDPDADVGNIVAIETEGSTVRVRELVDAGSIVDHSVSRGVDAQIVVLTHELALERVDPATGARERLLEQAAAHRWSIDGDMIAYQRPSDDPDDPGPVILRDQRTGAEQLVDPGFPVASGWLEDGLLHMVGAELGQAQWLRLDPLRALDLPADATLLRQQDDGTLWLERGQPEPGEYEQLLWREGEAPQSVLTCSPCRAAVHERAGTYSSVLLETAEPGRSELWRLDRAGGPPRLIGNALGTGTVLEDDRVLSVRVGDDREHGPLLLAHDLGEDDVTLAPMVDVSSIQWTLGLGAPDEIAYEEVHGNGTATLYRARLAAP